MNPYRIAFSICERYIRLMAVTGAFASSLLYFSLFPNITTLPYNLLVVEHIYIASGQKQYLLIPIRK